nr:MAG TPA_asm: Protein of unknown function (DUF1137) [Caudoviricetes sp.]DAS40960.1 MAG TPA: Protein of unknown function (DUF1137) [Bacteriophage sp.]
MILRQFFYCHISLSPKIILLHLPNVLLSKTLIQYIWQVFISK